MQHLHRELGAFPALSPLWGARRKPGFPLVSFLPAAKKDTASIPCANQNRWSGFGFAEFHKVKLQTPACSLFYHP
jgi:hypothetical protein